MIARHLVLAHRCRGHPPAFHGDVVAFGGDNVTVESGSDVRGTDRRTICRAITEGGVLTVDRDLLRRAAREMLTGVLSCRDNRSQSGSFARIAGEAIGASVQLPNMATEDFLSCLSRGALETAARTEGVNIAPRAKDTRARLVTRFKDGTFVWPGALFRLTVEEQAAAPDSATPALARVGSVRCPARRAKAARPPCRRPETKTQPVSTTKCRCVRPPDLIEASALAVMPGQTRFYPRTLS